MKKKIIITIIAILFLFPFKVNAASIDNVNFTLNSPETNRVGDEITLKVNANFSGLRDSGANLGMWTIGLMLNYDDSVLSFIGAEADGWASEIVEGKSVFSVTNLPDNSPYQCADNPFSCHNIYTATLKFIIKNTSATNTSITLEELGIGVINFDEINEEDIVEDDLETLINMTSEITSTVNQTQRINIAQQTTTVIEAKPNGQNQTPQENTAKSDSKYLKSLEIENYKIDFDKTKRKYTINIEENVNKLNVHAIAEDEKATVKIKGADDLKSNDNKITIEVTAENGDVYIYTINARNKSDVEESSVKKEEKEEYKIENKYLYIFLGAIIVPIVLIILIVFINDRRLKKKLENL